MLTNRTGSLISLTIFLTISVTLVNGGILDFLASMKSPSEMLSKLPIQFSFPTIEFSAKPPQFVSKSPAKFFKPKSPPQFFKKPERPLFTKPRLEFNKTPALKFHAKPSAAFFDQPAVKLLLKPSSQFHQQPPAKFSSNPSTQFYQQAPVNILPQRIIPQVLFAESVHPPPRYYERTANFYFKEDLHGKSKSVVLTKSKCMNLDANYFSDKPKSIWASDCVMVYKKDFCFGEGVRIAGMVHELRSIGLYNGISSIKPCESNIQIKFMKS